MSRFDEESRGGPGLADLPDALSDLGLPATEAEADATALPLVEETAVVAKREVVTGKVRVRTVVDTTEQMVRQELETSHVSVTRVPVGRYVDAAPPVRTEGEVTIVPVLEEVLIVETRLLLKEEVHIRRTSSREEVEHSVVLRSQSAVIEETDGDGRIVEEVDGAAGRT